MENDIKYALIIAVIITIILCLTKIPVASSSTCNFELKPNCEYIKRMFGLAKQDSNDFMALIHTIKAKTVLDMLSKHVSRKDLEDNINQDLNKLHKNLETFQDEKMKKINFSCPAFALDTWLY